MGPISMLAAFSLALYSRRKERHRTKTAVAHRARKEKKENLSAVFRTQDVGFTCDSKRGQYREQAHE